MVVAGEAIVLENRNDTTNARPIVEVLSKSRKDYELDRTYRRARTVIFKNIFKSIYLGMKSNSFLKPMMVSNYFVNLNSLRM